MALIDTERPTASSVAFLTVGLLVAGVSITLSFSNQHLVAITSLGAMLGGGLVGIGIVPLILRAAAWLEPRYIKLIDRFLERAFDL